MKVSIQEIPENMLYKILIAILNITCKKSSFSIKKEFFGTGNN